MIRTKIYIYALKKHNIILCLNANVLFSYINKKLVIKTLFRSIVRSHDLGIIYIHVTGHNDISWVRCVYWNWYFICQYMDTFAFHRLYKYLMLTNVISYIKEVKPMQQFLLIVIIKVHLLCYYLYLKISCSLLILEHNI